MAEFDPTDIDAEFARLVADDEALKQLDAVLPVLEPMDSVKEYINRAVGEHILCFAEDTFPNEGELRDTLNAIAELVCDQLVKENLLFKEDEIIVQGQGEIYLLDMYGDEDEDEGTEIECKNVDITDGSSAGGAFVCIELFECDWVREQRAQNAEQGLALPLRIGAVDAYLVLRDVVMHDTSEGPKTSEDKVVLVDLNSETLRAQRLAAPELLDTNE